MQSGGREEEVVESIAKENEYWESEVEGENDSGVQKTCAAGMGSTTTIEVIDLRTRGTKRAEVEAEGWWNEKGGSMSGGIK